MRNALSMPASSICWIRSGAPPPQPGARRGPKELAGSAYGPIKHVGVGVDDRPLEPWIGKPSGQREDRAFASASSWRIPAARRRTRLAASICVQSSDSPAKLAALAPRMSRFSSSERECGGAWHPVNHPTNQGHDHTITRDGLHEMLERSCGFEVVGRPGSAWRRWMWRKVSSLT